MSEELTVVEMRRLVDNAEQICERMDLDPADTPWFVGFISGAPVSGEALERGRRYAKEQGW